MPGNLAQWNGVYFVHKGKLLYYPSPAGEKVLKCMVGPYASAVLRFDVGIPTSLHRPPAITFRNELFHPLVAPVTTHSHAIEVLENEGNNARNGEELPPGGLSLVPGFPVWFSSSKSKTLNRMSVEEYASAFENAAMTEKGNGDEHGSFANPHPLPLEDAAPDNLDVEALDMVKVLEYVKLVFEDEDLLDTLSVDMIVNTGAWKAWQAHRGIEKDPPKSLGSDTPSAAHQRSASMFRARNKAVKASGEWSWQGVWADRVARNVEASISKPVLYGSHENDSVCTLRPCKPQILCIDTESKGLPSFPRFQPRGDRYNSEQAFAHLNLKIYQSSYRHALLDRLWDTKNGFNWIVWRKADQVQIPVQTDVYPMVLLGTRPLLSPMRYPILYSYLGCHLSQLPSWQPFLALPSSCLVVLRSSPGSRDNLHST